MESLQISGGVKCLRILDAEGKEKGIFKFNPTDIYQARQLLQLKSDMDTKLVEFEEQNKLCTTELESADLAVNIINYFKEGVDSCFGKGSSELLFGDTCTLSMFTEFIEGITPYYNQASKARTSTARAKYKKSK